MARNSQNEGRSWDQKGNLSPNLHGRAECGSGQMCSPKLVFGASALRESRLESWSQGQEPRDAPDW